MKNWRNHTTVLADSLVKRTFAKANYVAFITLVLEISGASVFLCCSYDLRFDSRFSVFSRFRLADHQTLPGGMPTSCLDNQSWDDRLARSLGLGRERNCESFRLAEGVLADRIV